ncbi:hypothetical protein ZWY2020_016919, partial [Hordeum vulgare]
GRFFWGFLVKEEKLENKGSIEFQVFSFTNKLRRLAAQLELHNKYFFIGQRSTKALEKR